MRTIILSANTSFALINYRIGLVRALRDAGFHLVALVPDPEKADALVRDGVEVRFVPISPHGTSPSADLKLLFAYRRQLKRLKPAAFLGYTIKPNIYGSLAARMAGVPTIANVTGLGMVFTNGGPVERIVSLLYKAALGRAHRVFFQNKEGRDLFLARRLVRPAQTELLPGSGVDLSKFSPTEGREDHAGTFSFLLPSRLMWAKGIAEYAAAAAWFRANRPDVVCKLLGPIEQASNRDAISQADLDRLQTKGLVYLSSTDDVRPFVAEADCVVLPSYYPEGVPRALIEAAAMGRPIITTDMPGCREVVEDGVTGFLCQPRSETSLLEAMKEMVARPEDQRLEMGRRARIKAEREFDEQFVVEAYLAAIRTIVSPDDGSRNR